MIVLSYQQTQRPALQAKTIVNFVNMSMTPTGVLLLQGLVDSYCVKVVNPAAPGRDTTWNASTLLRRFVCRGANVKRELTECMVSDRSHDDPHLYSPITRNDASKAHATPQQQQQKKKTSFRISDDTDPDPWHACVRYMPTCGAPRRRQLNPRVPTKPQGRGGHAPQPLQPACDRFQAHGRRQSTD